MLALCQKVLHPTVLEQLKKCRLVYLFGGSLQMELSTQELKLLILEWINGRYEAMTQKPDTVFAWSIFNLMLYINKCVNLTKKQIIILLGSLVNNFQSTPLQFPAQIDELVDTLIERIGPSLTVIEIDQLLDTFAPCSHEFL